MIEESNSWQRWIIKVGSSLITKDGLHLDADLVQSWAEQIVALKKQKKQVLLVSSGAIADGILKLGWNKRPQHLHQLQAAAAIGQTGLMEMYKRVFTGYGIHTAQILLTHEDFMNHQRYLNARTTLNTLLSLDVVPIINENDTISTKEIKFGDNDTLAAYVANLVDADIMLILTDQQGLFDCDPKTNKNAKLIKHIQPDDAEIDQFAGTSVGTLGRGGMITKVTAARRAALSGTSTIIADGKENNVIGKIAEGELIGTYMKNEKEPKTLRKRWIMSLKNSGTLTIDEGAYLALKTSGKSLLPIGVVKVDGDFKKGNMLTCKLPDQNVVAYGLTNYSRKEVDCIIGKNSSEIKKLLGEIHEEEIIHRDNLAIV